MIDTSHITIIIFIITYKSALLTLKYNGLVYADIFRMLGTECIDNLKSINIFNMNVCISNLQYKYI